MTSRKEHDQAAQLRLQLELDEEKEADKDYEDFLKQETQRLKLQGFTPRVSAYFLGCALSDFAWVVRSTKGFKNL